MEGLFPHAAGARRARHAAALALAMAGASISPAALAFATFNQGALARSFALPALGETAVLGAGTSASALTLDLTNEFHESGSDGEELLLDGETQRWALSWRRGERAGLEWGVELPLLVQGGGFLDDNIEDWHDAFSLPTGGREAAPHDRYRYYYARDGRIHFDQSDGGTALGDVRIAGGWQATAPLALRAMLQLPTGDEAQLGGGNAGAALWLDYALAGAGAWSSFASAGLSLNDDAALAPGQKRLLPFGGAGAAYTWSPDLAFAAQVYAHAPLYDNGQPEAFSRAGVQLAFGGSWRFAPSTSLDVALQEDIVTRSSPDFSIHFALRLAAGSAR